MFIIKIFYFLLLMIISDRCLKWVWKAVYRSAYKKEEDVERYRELGRFGRRKDYTTSWVINSSPTPYKTLALVWLFYLGLLPAAAGQILVLFSLLSPSMERVVNIFSVAVPVLCVIYFIAGLIYNKVAKDPDYDKFSKDHITDYESQKLASYAEDWKTGEYKSKSRFVPSKLPQYIFIAVWCTLFIAGMVIIIVFDGKIDLKPDNNQTYTSVTEIPSTTKSNDPLVAEMQEYRAMLNEKNVYIYEDARADGRYDTVVDSFWMTDRISGTVDVYLFESVESAEIFCEERTADDVYSHHTEENCEMFIRQYENRYIGFVRRNRFVAEINTEIDSLPKFNDILSSMDFCEIK